MRSSLRPSGAPARLRMSQGAKGVPAGPRWLLAQGAGLALAALAIWVLFAQAGLDRAITGFAFDAARGKFPLRDTWALTVLGHEGLKYAVLAFWCVCAAGALLPRRWSGQWRGTARHAALGMALAALVVTALKQASAHSCPWDLADYGGQAEWFAPFAALPADPGPGRCLPAGHPSVGFALFAFYFALRDAHPRAARIGLAAAWLVGLVASAVQVARGAHFVSHTLWTAWIAWAVNLALYVALRRAEPRP